MTKKTLKQLNKQEEQDRIFINQVRAKIVRDWGKKCADHPEECPICNAYKALNELERLYGQKETN